MKLYRGTRKPAGCEVLVEEGDEKSPLHHVLRHSPDGFEWGYHGSGPADLALSLLADASGDEDLAERYYQAFKREVVSQLPRERWTLEAAYVAAWLLGARRRAAAAG